MTNIDYPVCVKHLRCELPAYLRLEKYASSPMLVHIYDPAYLKWLRYCHGTGKVILICVNTLYYVHMKSRN